MRYAIKNKENIVLAYEMGVGGAMERALRDEGAIRQKVGGYRLFPIMTVNDADGRRDRRAAKPRTGAGVHDGA